MRSPSARPVLASVCAAALLASMAACAGGSSAPKHPAAASACAPADLSAFTRGRDFSMHSFTEDLVFTDRGSLPCRLSGYPTVYYLDAAGARVGQPAANVNPSDPMASPQASPAPVTLQPGGQAAVLLEGYEGVGAFDPTTCRLESVSELVVELPGRKGSLTVADQDTACSGDIGQPLLDVGPFTALHL
jgi:Protein of unknown function (DUF4232)